MTILRRVALAILVTSIVGTPCLSKPQQEKAPLASESSSLPAAEVPRLLRNMPTNSDQRCVGIAGVAAILLEGERLELHGLESDIRSEELALMIFDRLSSEDSIQYPSHLSIHGRPVSVESADALRMLSDQVAELYKSEARRMNRSAFGRKRLRLANAAFIESERALHNTLDADPDKTELFCCLGYRRFPNGSYKETYHAVLFRKTPQGNVVVFDPNDPGKPIEIEFDEDERRLMVKWKCVYQDTGQQTTQTYQVIPRRTYFSIARGEDTTGEQVK